METNEKKQFDSFIGGDVSLPNDVNIFKIAAARANEIAFMEKSLKNQSSTKLIFQKLPLHMRRRVMSHNAKRLPRRLRAAHISQQLKSGLPPKQKRPSRKYRRRPSNLQAEYVRRQRRVKWLETHIWHAKRFHMVERWNHKIPDCPCDKSFRALYRASARHCLIQDISYYTCIELKGERNYLVDKLRSMTNSSLGLRFSAKCFQNGQREGLMTLFKSNSYPRKAIGNVSYIWRSTNNEQLSTLWIWAHPSCSSELMAEFEFVFSDKSETDTNPNVSTMNSKDPTSNQKVSTNSEVSNSESPSVRITNLQGELNRFRLTGPLAHVVLKNSLKLADNSNVNEQNWSSEFFNSNWEQNSFWNELHVSSAGELASNSVINLIVCDPRFNMPKKRTKSTATGSDENYELICTDLNLPNSSDNPIWDPKIRKACLNDKSTNAQICKLKSEQLVPGEDNSVIKKFACTPVILIQRPGNQTDYIGYGNGYDIITPAGWGLPLWHTLIMWGARAGGLREDRVSILENQRGPSNFYPDTSAGKSENLRLEREQKEKYFRLPPKKRVNYIKNGIVSPFRFNWEILIRDWLPDKEKDFVNNFYVLRNLSLLRNIQSLLDNKQVEFDKNMLTEPILVPVKIELIDRGAIHDFAIICLPDEDDVCNKREQILEKVHDDPNASVRKKLRQEHKKLLKRLKRKRTRVRRKWKEQHTSNEKPVVKSSSTIVAQHLEKMRQLWLPESTTIRYNCSHQTIGFVTQGDFSFIKAKVVAVGFITLQSLILIKNKKVLVRDRNSYYYRFANINIVL